jgi:hypothetical protein
MTHVFMVTVDDKDWDYVESLLRAMRDGAPTCQIHESKPLPSRRRKKRPPDDPPAVGGPS